MDGMQISNAALFFLIISILWIIWMLWVWKKDRQRKIGDMLTMNSHHLLKVQGIRGKQIRDNLLRLEQKYELSQDDREDARFYHRKMSLHDAVPMYSHSRISALRQRLDSEDVPQEGVQNKRPTVLNLCTSLDNQTTITQRQINSVQEGKELYTQGAEQETSPHKSTQDTIPYQNSNSKEDKKSLFQIIVHVVNHNHQIISIFTTQFKNYSRFDRILIYLVQFSNLVSSSGLVVVEQYGFNVIIDGMLVMLLYKAFLTFYKHLLKQKSGRMIPKQPSKSVLKAHLEKQINKAESFKVHVAHLLLFCIFITDIYYVFAINARASSSEQDLWIATWLWGFFFDLIVLEAVRIAIQLVLIYRVNPVDQNAFWSLIYYIIITKSIVDLFE